MNKTQQQALKAELAGVAYNGLTAQEKADKVNTDFSTTDFKKVEYADVISYLMVVGKWLSIKTSSVDAAQELMDAVDRFNSFDLNKPLVKAKIEATLDNLIAATPSPLLSATDKAAILSLANKTVAESLGLGTVLDYHITNAENA